MPIHRLTPDAFLPLEPTTYAAVHILERQHLQRLLKADISVIVDDVLIIAEEFANWDESDRRIDLLGVDRDANLVVVEIKRDEKGGHMELQAIRYAAMVSSMTFAKAVDAYQVTLGRSGESAESAQVKLLEFFGWDEPREDAFAGDVRIVLVSADFSKEVTTAVLWLNERDLDVRCVRVKPYRMGDEILIDVQQVVPLPEASEYQIRVREKAIVRRESARLQAGEATGYWFMNVGESDHSPNRDWADCRKYGFMTAGGGPRFREAIRRLSPGDRFFAYATGHGYVGFGEVISAAIPQRDFVPPGQSKRLVDLPTAATPERETMGDDDRCEWCAAVRWTKTLRREEGVLSSGARRGTVVQIKSPELVRHLLHEFSPDQVGRDGDPPPAAATRSAAQAASSAASGGSASRR